MLPIDRAAGFLLTGTAGIIGAAEIPSELSFVKSIAEVGSFGLVAFAGVFLLIKGLPAFLNALTTSQANFLSALDKERELREKTKDDFREMLASHKGHLAERMDNVVDSIEKGNTLTAELVQELKDRPCQKK